MQGLAGSALGALVIALTLAACTHRVQVGLKDPIVINLNVKIEQEWVLGEVDREVEDLFADNPELF